MRSWLEKLGDETLQKAVRDVLDSLSWGLGLRALGASSTVDNLASLLSNDWLDDCTIDMLSTDLNLCAPAESSAAVATLTFVFHIMASYGRNPRKDTAAPVLERYIERARQDTLRHLYFPVHLNSNHWVAFLIDFENGTICYG